MGKKKQKKAKKSCCGKFLKKGKACSNCPVKLKGRCRKLTEAKAKAKKAKKAKKGRKAKKKKDKK